MFIFKNLLEVLEQYLKSMKKSETKKKIKNPPLTRFLKGVFFLGKQNKERRKTIVDNIEE